MQKKITDMSDEELDAAIASLRETRIPGPIEKKTRKPRRLDDQPTSKKKPSWRDDLFGDE